MKKTILTYITLFFLILSLCLPLSACDTKEKIIVEDDPVTEEAELCLTDVSTKKRNPELAAIPEYSGGDTLSVAFADNVNSLNPFFASTQDEKTIADLLNIRLFPFERSDRIVISKTQSDFLGESFEYNGIADASVNKNRIDITLNNNVYFSDGVNLTADDVIFSLYVLCDPAYTGENTLSDMPILGLRQYRGMGELKWKLILTNLQENGIKFKKNNNYTEEDYNTFITAFDEAGVIFTQYIVDNCMENFAKNYSELAIGKSYDELSENEHLQIAFAEFMWGYASSDGEHGVWRDESGTEYDLTETYPELIDFWHLIAKRYNYDISDDGVNTEKVADDDFSELLVRALEKCPELLVAVTSQKTADCISGVEKTGMYSLSITMETEEFDINDMDFYVCPLHVYGSRENFDYLQNKFGFEKGNLREIKENQSFVGAGAYKFVALSEEGRIVLERNALYYKGCPYVTNIVFEENGTDIVRGVIDGYTVLPTLTKKTICIGMNPEKVSAGGDAYSKYSLALRKAIYELICAYKYEYIQENTEPITSVMPIISRFYSYSPETTDTTEALENAKRLLCEAGYIWNEENGTFDTAFTDSTMKFEFLCCASHSAAAPVRAVADTLASLGFEIAVTEAADMEMLAHIVANDAADIWIAEFDSAEEILDSRENEEVEKMLAMADSADLANVRKAYIDKAAECIKSSYTIIPLYTESVMNSFSQRIDTESLPDKATVTFCWQNCAEVIKMF